MSVLERPGRAVQVMVSKCDELVERSNNGRENREEEGGPKKQRKHYTTLLTRFWSRTRGAFIDLLGA